MLPLEESRLLAPNFIIAVRWSARVADFAEQWRQRQVGAFTGPPPAYWADAARAVQRDIEQGRRRALDLLTFLFNGCGQLPAAGDVLELDALEVKVDQRRFVTSQLGGGLQVEVYYYLSVEQYRYAGPLARFSSLN